jgi:hypothetical protein
VVHSHRIILTHCMLRILPGVPSSTCAAVLRLTVHKIGTLLCVAPQEMGAPTTHGPQMFLAFWLRPFRILLHLTIDVTYIDIKIVPFGMD